MVRIIDNTPKSQYCRVLVCLIKLALNLGDILLNLTHNQCLQIDNVTYDLAYMFITFKVMNILTAFMLIMALILTFITLSRLQFITLKDCDRITRYTKKVMLNHICINIILCCCVIVPIRMNNTAFVIKMLNYLPIRMIKYMVMEKKHRWYIQIFPDQLIRSNLKQVINTSNLRVIGRWMKHTHATNPPIQHSNRHRNWLSLCVLLVLEIFVSGFIIILPKHIHQVRWCIFSNLVISITWIIMLLLTHLVKNHS